MDEAVAAIAAHLGVVNEDEINNMSIPFFHNVLSAIGRRLNYESISNLYGNSFCKDAGKHIQDAYPLLPLKKIGSGMINMLSQATIIKADTSDSDVAVKAIGQQLGGDISWAEGLLK